MTGKELLKKSGDELAALSETQLKAYFAPYLIMIKPEQKEDEEGELNLGKPRKKVMRGPSELDKTMALFNKFAEKHGMEKL